jgi:TorA maturation chaperone TorD
MTQAAPLKFVAPEEQARANLYGLLARLFYAAPDAALLDAMAGQAMEGESLAAPWRELVAARGTPEALEDEYDTLFGGTGKAKVTPYLSAYLPHRANEHPLATLRGLLAGWGVARRAGVPEYEDHVSGVCETMRFAIAVQQRAIADQKHLFDSFLYPGAVGFCGAVSASKDAHFYRAAAQFTRAFLDIEKAAFEMFG